MNRPRLRLPPKVPPRLHGLKSKNGMPWPCGVGIFVPIRYVTYETMELEKEKEEIVCVCVCVGTFGETSTKGR